MALPKWERHVLFGVGGALVAAAGLGGMLLGRLAARREAAFAGAGSQTGGTVAAREGHPATAQLKEAVDAPDEGVASPAVVEEASRKGAPADAAIAEGEVDDDTAAFAGLIARLAAAEKASREGFDLNRFLHELASASNPIQKLRSYVAAIRAKDPDAVGDKAQDADDVLAEGFATFETEQAPKPEGEGSGQVHDAPSVIEAYLARSLVEAGLFASDARLPKLSVVLPHRSGTVYLRIEEPRTSYGAMLRVLALESALNRALFAWEGLVRDADEQEAASLAVEDCFRYNQALEASVTFQLGDREREGGSLGPEDSASEWSVRQAMATGIETFRLPHRLDASFRTNVAGRVAAIEFHVTPAEAFPTSWYSDELARIVPTTRSMRERQASAYAIRVALLLAEHALRCSELFEEVWVSGVHDNPLTHECLLAGRITREALESLDLTEPFDPLEAGRAAGLSLETANDALQPIRQPFSLDDERFCPSSRYEVVDLSERRLGYAQARSLGAGRVSDLAINEHARREHVASEIVRNLTGSTERNVRMILDVAGSDPDASVRTAAQRTVGKLIDGTLSESDAFAVEHEFIAGDALSRACDRALELISAGDNNRAIDVLTDALAPLDALDVYRDTPDVVYRAFSSYVGRTLYNRLMGADGRRVVLVPDAYYNAHLLMSTALLQAGRVKPALGHALRAMDLDPLGVAGYLRAVRAHELLGEFQEAADTLIGYLGVAYDPEGIGTSYYRLAFMEYRLHNLELAFACYRKAVASKASCSQMAVIETRAVAAWSGVEAPQLSVAEADRLLELANIPLAPTERVSDVLVEAARAATDAEVFPVARNFATLLGMLSGDDVMQDIVGSMELEPDR